jgi:DNA repair protein RadA/Sms
MAKATTRFVCSACGYESVRWFGKCPGCSAWNTLAEETIVPQIAATKRQAAAPAASALLQEVDVSTDMRTPTCFLELDRVLGGGIVEGCAVLAGGEPGIGKSTLFLQVMAALAAKGHKTIYVSGEESQRQIRLRAQRIGVSDKPVHLISETEVNAILSRLEELAPRFVVVDSIQTLYNGAIASSAGSVAQVKDCAAKLSAFAKQTGASVFLIGHVTKEGAIAGPRVLEHMVDTVLYFEGESTGAYRILRAVKNRFGSTNEIGVFEMKDTGIAEVLNFGGMFISEREEGVAGSAVFCGMEGTRPLLIEIQALVSHTPFNIPRRMASGADFNRTALIIAVLEKKTGLKLFDQDIYINVAGGLKLTEPAADLAIAASIVSAFRNKPLAGFAVFGEMGLTGEIRSVGLSERRIGECLRMGFTKAVIPKANMAGLHIPPGMTVYGVKNIWEALEKLL